MKIYAVQLKPSKNKRFKFFILNPATGKSKVVQFGSKNGSTYVDHKDPVKKKNYIARHSALKTENWSDPFTAGFWARWYLWEEPSIPRAEKFLNRNFSIEFVPLEQL